MEAAFIVAGFFIGGSLLFIVVALLTKPRRMKKAQREAEARAKEVTDIYGRVAVTRVKLGGLERATRILEDARENDDVTK